MKHLSIKLRLVILHTLLMTIIIALVLALLFSISSNNLLANVSTSLMNRVNESYEFISYDNGLDFDNDFLEVNSGIFLSAYDEDNPDLLYGRIPYGFNYELDFSIGEIREIRANSINYYVYDTLLSIDGYGNIIVRGVVSISDAQRDFDNTLRLALILSPLLIILVAIAGYLLSKRAMSPITKINDTVDDIRKSGDLSKRVNLGKGNDEIYKLANTFDELLDDIEKSMTREKQFTSDIAHELRTPITIINMTIEDLLNNNEFNTDVKEDLMIIKNKSDLMAKILKDLLVLSKIDQGEYKPNKERLNFSEIVKMVALEFSDLAKSKDIILNCDIQDNIYFDIDETLIIRLLTNVLDNALKYTRTSIGISLHKDTDIVLSITDDGIGISKEDQEHIFDRFYQVDKSRSSKGSGLGLAMVKWITKTHNGKINLVSELNKGSNFIFTFKV